MRSKMKTLTKVWKKLPNEAGMPVSDIIDELRKNLGPAWEEGKSTLIRHNVGCPAVDYDIVTLHIE
jgi:hypothetical protein